MLAPANWRRVASWTCGWLYVVGNITITRSVNFGTTLFFIGCINVFEKEPGVGVFEGSSYQVFLLFVAVTLLCNAVSALGNKWLPWLDVGFLVSFKRRDNCFADLNKDCRYLLDLCRGHRHDGHDPCHRQGWSSRCQIRLWEFREQLWLARWLVFLRRPLARRLCHFLYRHDHLVSCPRLPPLSLIHAADTL